MPQNQFQENLRPEDNLAPSAQYGLKVKENTASAYQGRLQLDAERGPKKAKTALHEAERRSVKVVAGARNPREFQLFCPI